MHNQVLRKLDEKELSIVKRSGNFTLNFHVSSVIDLFSKIESIKEAIQKWKFKHPLLRAQIVKQENGHFFILKDNDQLKDNVRFLRLNESDKIASLPIEDKEKLNAQLTNLLTEKAVNDTISSYEPNKLLWNFSFLEVLSRIHSNTRSL